MTTIPSEQYFFHQPLYWLHDFDWLLTACDYLILTFHLFILVKFSILARKMRHNARQSDTNQQLFFEIESRLKIIIVFVYTHSVISTTLFVKLYMNPLGRKGLIITD